MIGKCKAIAHGSTALDYIFREGKLGYRLVFHNLCSREPKSIYEEMKVVSDYNSRCRNKFLRIEIGIAPQDEKKLPVSELMRIAHLFAKRMGLDNHQWVAVTHKDTDNRHIHIIEMCIRDRKYIEEQFSAQPECWCLSQLYIRAFIESKQYV